MNLMNLHHNLPYSHQISSIPDKLEKCGDKVKIQPFPHPQKHFPKINKRVEVILENFLTTLSSSQMVMLAKIIKI